MKTKIKCPNCNGVAEGTIKQEVGMPFHSYFGYCSKCNYHIMESEFEEIGG